MSRPLRVEFEGACYHVTARGNERRAVFRGDEDRRQFGYADGSGVLQVVKRLEARAEKDEDLARELHSLRKAFETPLSSVQR